MGLVNARVTRGMFPCEVRENAVGSFGEALDRCS